MAAESGKIDPMHQFEVTPLGGGFHLGGHEILFTNSALWMVVAAITLGIFMWGGMRRQLVPGRWQAAVEGFTGFISSMMTQNIGSEGRKFTPYVFSLFMFILFCNLLGMLPLGVFGIHPFTVTSHIAITGVLALVSFAIVLVVGFWRHGLHFFSLFVPHGTPLPMSRSRSAQGAVGLRYQRIQRRNGLARVDRLGPQLHPDDRYQRARTARCRYPGLCFRPVDLALHQRRGQPSLIPFIPNAYTQGVLQWTQKQQS